MNIDLVGNGALQNVDVGSSPPLPSIAFLDAAQLFWASDSDSLSYGTESIRIS